MPMPVSCTDSVSSTGSMPGGELSVTVTRDGDGIKDIMLTGPTNIVARGEITDEDLNA